MARTRKTKKPEVRPHLELQPAMVENPLWSRAHDGERANPRRIPVVVNLRESAVSALAARGLIDEAEAAAAIRFRALWEAMGGAGAGAIDYARERVDGGPPRDPVRASRIEAGRQLKAARELLGAYGYRLVFYIAGEGRSIHDLAATRRQRDTMTDNLRTFLDQLAELWGFAGRARR